MDYQKGKIYKIESHLGDKIYVGATTKEYLSQRMTAHRKSYGEWKNGKSRKMTSFDLFEEYGIENCNIVLLELCPCNSKDELSAREGHYVKTLCCVNKCIPGQTKKEYDEKYYKEYSEKIKKYANQYRESNKDKIKEHKTQPLKCDCGCTIQYTEKARHQRTKKHIELMKNKAD